MENALVPAGGSLVILDASGNQVSMVPAAQANAYMQGRSGGQGWQTAGQAVQAFGNLMQVGELREIRDDVREKRNSLRKKQKALLDALKKENATTAQLFESVFAAQRQLDREQNQMIGAMLDNAYLQLGGQGLQLAGSLMGGSRGGMGGLNDGSTLAIGIGAAVLMREVWDDDHRRSDSDSDS